MLKEVEGDIMLLGNDKMKLNCDPTLMGKENYNVRKL